MTEPVLGALDRTAASSVGQWIGRTLARARGSLPAGHDWTLWHQACAGNAQSAQALVRLLAPQAHGLALRMLGCTEDAQDVVQESFLRLWSARPSDGQGARLSTYFNTIVLNRCKTHLQQRREFSTDPESLTELADARQSHDEGADQAVPRATAAQLQQALTGLPARQRMALAMWAYADADAAEIARALGIDANAAHQLLHRAKTALRLLLTGPLP